MIHVQTYTGNSKLCVMLYVQVNVFFFSCAGTFSLVEPINQLNFILHAT